MFLAASESAVTKKPRLRLTTRRSSSVRPLGSFQSWMSRLMLISCGIQWFAQAEMYFSQAHLYLNGTSWLTSALELMTRLSSTLTRRRVSSVFAWIPGPAGTKPETAGWIASSKLSIFVLLFLGVRPHRAVQQQRAQAGQLGVGDGGAELGAILARRLALGRRALARGGKRHLVRRHVQIPVRAGDRDPLRVTRACSYFFHRKGF